ncbi:MAG: pyruvate:ferredoxin (flavodoxin) oxidoreductase [Spirulinaceae cyanobacterium SM2_1_0]|nr:pyruvate:ferredoxin (flavodoxin) oxidoreductase [Spirulinaceae cyanobacterium SM2_1_0]
MSNPTFATLDGNEAVARIAYKLNEVIAIYPITPASPMGEWSDAWMSEERPNLWGTVPSVVALQAESGAAASVHGALQTGSLTTTFTASQGLLLMIPNMYKIAGELSPCVIHVAARSLAAQALSIFGDHSDVMAARATGFAMLCSASVQEAHDLALIAHVVTLETRVPFLHFFDGFRTSHEVQKIKEISDDVLRQMVDDEWIFAHRNRAMTPDRPVLRGTAQNPDVYFQARESANPFYEHCGEAVERAMVQFQELTGREYQLYQYVGAPDAERVIVLMGSGAETAHEAVAHLTNQGEKIGVLKVRLYRPFVNAKFVAALPETVKAIAVLDRTKEPGAAGDPLYLDVVNALMESWPNATVPKVIGGRYGLSSKEFTPAMVKGLFDNLAQAQAKNHFTIGINDDVSHTSLSFDRTFDTEPDNVVRAMFYGLGSDGTVGANKNTIKIIGGETDNYAQGYFVYDSKKSGAVTISHLRFGPQPIRSTYLISQANFVGCHQWTFLEKLDVLSGVANGAIFLLNSPYGPDEVWSQIPLETQEQIVRLGLKFYVIDANKVARESGMGNRINTVMQTCFFALSNVLPREQAIAQIKKAIEKTYGKKGQRIVQMNLQAVDSTLDNLFEVNVGEANSLVRRRPAMPDDAPEFVREVEGKILVNRGDELPVSALPCDGTYPTDTAKWEKRNVAQFIPTWDPDVCVQCGKCILLCPHAVIRGKVYDEAQLANAPETFKATASRDRDFRGQKFTIQVSPEDCTGCGICVDVCPAKNKAQPSRRALNMEDQLPLREPESANWDFFLDLPAPDRTQLKLNQVRQQQLQEPLFEFSGACAGCGETPYLKLASQLFGDRMIIANATGCSSIYGGNLPTTPWAKDAHGRGPTWSNSLFEDNAEFGFGFRLSLDKHAAFATELLQGLAGQVGDNLASAILGNSQKTEADIWEQRDRVAALKQALQGIDSPEAKQLASLADYLVKKSVWLVGGDGWAYDIGFGGLDHVLASGRNVNALVMDTEVYSNTGGQASKATPRGAVAKFAAGGKPAAKKDLGLIAMTYGNIYVASVAMGARDEHTLRAFLEAEAYDGPSLIIAYSHCIAHGINMQTAMTHQKEIVESGRWLLYRYNPDLAAQGQNPLQLDSRAPKKGVQESMYNENRFKMLTKTKPDAAKQLLADAQADVNHRWQMYEYLASRQVTANGNGSNGNDE